MNEHPNAGVIRSAYEAVERGDMETFAAALDDDIVWHESVPGFEGTYHGRDEAVGLLEGPSSTRPSTKSSIHTTADAVRQGGTHDASHRNPRRR